MVLLKEGQVVERGDCVGGMGWEINVRKEGGELGGSVGGAMRGKGEHGRRGHCAITRVQKYWSLLELLSESLHFILPNSV